MGYTHEEDPKKVLGRKMLWEGLQEALQDWQRHSGEASCLLSLC